MTKSFVSVLAISACALAALTSCSSTSGGAESASESTTPASTAAAQSSPGKATCTFNNEPVGDEGTDTSQYGTLDEATLEETADKYILTVTGDFVDPDTKITADTKFSLSTTLWADKDPDGTANTVMLQTQWRDADIEFNGTVGKQSTVTDDTDPDVKFPPEKVTATYPKSDQNLDGFKANQWSVDVGYSIYSEDPAEESQIYSFECGDGFAMEWQPLG